MGSAHAGDFEMAGYLLQQDPYLSIQFRRRSPVGQLTQLFKKYKKLVGRDPTRFISQRSLLHIFRCT